MKSGLNLLFLLIVLMVFSIEKGFSGCHDFANYAEQCHSCHEDKTTDEQKSKNNHDESECAMACCHTVMQKLDHQITTSVMIVDFDFDYPRFSIGSPQKAICDVFRPPIKVS
jgi:hypothetical protein